MAKFKDKKQKEKEEEAFQDFLNSFNKMEPSTADFFRYYIIEGVDRITAYEMSHDVPDFEGKDAAKRRRNYIKRVANEKAHTTLFTVTKKKYYAYKALKSEGIADILLDANMSIVQSLITKTFYIHPKTGKPISRHPGQLGRNEAIAATSMTSAKGKTEYRLESKTAASKIVMGLLGLNEPLEANVHYDGLADDDSITYLFSGMGKKDDEL